MPPHPPGDPALIRSLHLKRLLLFFVLSYGFLYFSYKWLDPTQVNTDFIQYYGMVQHPLDFHAAPSPWVYRQLTTLVAHTLWRAHIFYPNDIQFRSPAYDQHIFFAVLFTNYLGVVLAAWLSTLILDRALRDSSQASSTSRGTLPRTVPPSLVSPSPILAPLVAGMLCFFSFYLQVTTVAGQADGLSWTLVALCYLFYQRRSLLPLCAALLLSITQREVLPLIFLCFATVTLIQTRPPARSTERRFLTITALWSLLVFALYLLLRHLIHAPGNEYQAQPHAILHELLHFRPTRAYVMQVLIGQNLLLVLFVLWFLLYRRTGARSSGFLARSPNLFTIPITCLMLLVISIMTNISNNASRMLAMLTPIVTAEIALILLRFDRLPTPHASTHHASSPDPLNP